jgi:serralysin
MARLYANYALDINGLNLNRIISGYYDSQFLNNTYLTVGSYTYEDTLDVIYYSGGYLAALFGGNNFTFDSSGRLTSGTVTGYLQGLYSGNMPVAWWGIEGMTYSAANMYSAALTSSTSDDFQIISSILSGDDEFYLSDYSDFVFGYGGNDVIYGLGGDDSLVGGAGNDTLDGGTGADSMTGGAGNDVYIIDNVGDVVTENSSQGTDTIRTSLASYSLAGFKAVENLLYTGISAATLIGNSLANTLTGSAGNDTLDGGAGNDTLTGGAGNDIYYVDAAGDVIIEAASDNTPEQEKFSMGNNNDVVITSTNYVLTANAAVEDVMAKGTLTGSTTNANINLTANDLGQGLIGNEGKNTLTGKNGEDVLVGMGGDDILNGGDGFDILIGGAGKDTLNGGAGNDVFLFNIGSAEGTDFVGNSGSISLTGGTDTIDGGDGEDDTIILTGTLSDYTLSKTSATEYRIVANQMLLGATSVETATFKNIENLGFINTTDDLENDNVTVVSLSSIPIASPFADILNAPSDLDWSINGLAGNDSITGGAGNDTLDGGAGNDTLTGGAGNDVLIGGLGNDLLTGGSGADIFRFSTPLSKTNIDTITDFVTGTDRIELDDAIFKKFIGTTGQLTADKFTPTNESQGLTDYIVAKIVQVNGVSATALFYDADGSNKGAAVQFATLVGVGFTDISASDFWIV